MVSPTDSVGLGAIYEYALARERAGEHDEADLLWRLAYARGEDGAELDAAVDRINETTFAEGRRIFLCDGMLSPREIESASDVREVLSQGLGSRFTLPDLVELFDIGEPAVRLKSLLIDRSSLDNSAGDVSFGGEYEVAATMSASAHDAMIRYVIDLSVDEDGVRIRRRDIEIEPGLRRLGMGARSLLSLALFGRRHGCTGWRGEAYDEGCVAWPKLGARISSEGIDEAIQSLSRISVEVEVREVLDRFLRDTPRRIDRLMQTGGELNELAGNGLLGAYQRARTEVRLLNPFMPQPPIAVETMALMGASTVFPRLLRT